MRSDTPEYIRTLAVEMRKNPTEAEEKLWNILRKRKMDGFKFKRQEPVARRYIADFYCSEKKFVIELDGKVHLCEDRKELDLERDKIMTGAGLTVLRIRNEDVLENLEYVKNKIRNILNYLNSPSPDASGEGVGG